MPVPEDADSPRFRTNIGSVHYAPEKSAIIWKIKQFGGGKEFLMRAELGLPSVKGDDEHGGGMTGGFGGSMGGAQGGGKGKRPISVKFEIPYFTTSGIQVRYLKIIEPKVCANSYFSCTNLCLAQYPISLPHKRSITGFAFISYFLHFLLGGCWQQLVLRICFIPLVYPGCHWPLARHRPELRQDTLYAFERVVNRGVDFSQPAPRVDLDACICIYAYGSKFKPI